MLTYQNHSSKNCVFSIQKESIETSCLRILNMLKQRALSAKIKHEKNDKKSLKLVNKYLEASKDMFVFERLLNELSIKNNIVFPVT